MKIIAIYNPPPISTDKFDWYAVDEHSFDGNGKQPMGHGRTREEAIIHLLTQICEIPDEPRLELCSEVNPKLWAIYCALKNRPNDPSFVWTEADVVQAIDGMFSDAEAKA
jgi:hypothetical protein